MIKSGEDLIFMFSCTLQSCFKFFFLIGFNASSSSRCCVKWLVSGVNMLVQIVINYYYYPLPFTLSTLLLTFFLWFNRFQHINFTGSIWAWSSLLTRASRQEWMINAAVSRYNIWINEHYFYQIFTLFEDPFTMSLHMFNASKKQPPQLTTTSPVDHYQGFLLRMLLHVWEWSWKG